MRLRGGAGRARATGITPAEAELVGVAAYVRVSSKSQNFATQADAIKRASKARGDDIAQWFEEKRTAKTSDRPALNELRRLVREGAIRKLYVFRLDRLTRSGIRDTLTIVHELREHGCTLVTLTDGLVHDGPMGDLVIAALACAAQIERLAGDERRAAARERLLSEGGTWGRPKRTSDVQEQRVGELLAQHRSLRAIAVAMKIPRATVGRIAQRLKSHAQNGATPNGKKPGRRSSVPPPAH
jgi:DNA invertase Pin-like site-specific DNA recombinase